MYNFFLSQKWIMEYMLIFFFKKYIWTMPSQFLKNWFKEKSHSSRLERGKYFQFKIIQKISIRMKFKSLKGKKILTLFSLFLLFFHQMELFLLKEKFRAEKKIWKKILEKFIISKRWNFKEKNYNTLLIWRS